jgi:hypothetical protein
LPLPLVANVRASSADAIDDMAMSQTLPAAATNAGCVSRIMLGAG